MTDIRIQIHWKRSTFWNKLNIIPRKEAKYYELIMRPTSVILNYFLQTRKHAIDKFLEIIFSNILPDVFDTYLIFIIQCNISLGFKSGLPEDQGNIFIFSAHIHCWIILDLCIVELSHWNTKLVPCSRQHDIG